MTTTNCQKIPVHYPRHVFRDLSGRVMLDQIAPSQYNVIVHVRAQQRPIGHIHIATDGRYVDSRGLCGAVGWDSIHCAVNGLVYADFLDHNGRFINKRFTPPSAGEPHGANLNKGMRETE